MRRLGPAPPRPAAAAIASCRWAMFWAGLFSGAINVLMLTGPLFMLQVYDRVLASRSLPTLQVLVILVVGLYLFQSGLDLLRSRMFARMGKKVELRLRDLAFEANLDRGLAPATKESVAPFRDLDQLKSFLSGGGPSAIFDLPWMPLYVAVLFVLHFWMGMLGIAGVFILSVMTIIADLLSQAPQRRAAVKASEASTWAEAARRNADVALSLGMHPHLLQVWRKTSDEAGTAQMAGSDSAAFFGALSRCIRMLLQSVVLAVGAWLTILGEVTGGAMIAASITLGRAMAPVELAIAHWRGFVAARQSFRRLETALAGPAAAAIHQVSLPPPGKTLIVEQISVGPVGANMVLIRDVALALNAGDAVGVIGPSGSGKSTLARALVGLWPPLRGSIRLDGATLDQWSRVERGRFIGYLPQAIELFSGTVAQNIARFDPEMNSEEVLSAAEASGVDQLVRRMPEGFETPVGESGSLLSAGQRQRIALARALFRNPFLVVLDEPNSNLDAEGEAALTTAIQAVRERGGVAVIIAHRPSALAACNLVLVMAEGRVQAFGPKEEVLRRVLQQPQAAA